MMEGLREALQYITGLKAESMEPKSPGDQRGYILR